MLILQGYIIHQKVFSQQLKGFNCFIYSNPDITNSLKGLLFRHENINGFKKPLTLLLLWYMITMII